ncbi:hypothetical protein QA601_18570 [Chitinispirillales bacterium ANBcel5]|uniref:hypothetical protein n=1 Tax=Cellulosispirillum alkaliphilum TaxID=3039283 RepID=UPI002A516597|nr:hypothetical protein [Chitinispirillales bacterium ANBcel5]
MLFPLLMYHSCFSSEYTEEQPEIINNRNNCDSTNIATSLVDEFYNWYIHQIYKTGNSSDYQNAPFKELAPDKYGLDIETYKQKLDKIHYFSEGYKSALISKNLKCSIAMMNSNHEFNPFEEMFHLGEDNHICNILWYDNWLGGQGENINGYKISDVYKVDSTSYSIHVHILLDDEVFSTADVTVEFQSENAKISNIDLNF